MSWETATGKTYVLTADDVFDGRNRLGSDVRHIPLDVLLCQGCDTPVQHGLCHNCCVVHLDAEQLVEVEHIAPGRIAA